MKKIKKAKISTAILKNFRGKGVGTKAFRKAIRLFKKTKKVKIILAEIHKDNLVSQKFFKNLNFKLKERKGKWLECTLNI